MDLAGSISRLSVNFTPMAASTLPSNLNMGACSSMGQSGNDPGAMEEIFSRANRDFKWRFNCLRAEFTMLFHLP